MPTTINGIGTHYYGKRNLQTRQGVCEHCHAHGQLSSYETRLWFVVVFIPVIPLGRKQIIDQCPRCTRHRVASLGEFQRAGQQAIEAISQAARENPTDPVAAMKLHAALVAFQQGEEADEQARSMEARFPDHADVQMYLGAWHAQEGRDDQADARFEQALALEPDNRTAARAVAIGCIEKGDLARASDLLSFMRSPGPDRDLAVIVMLADAFQAHHDHANALSWYRTAIEGSPRLARDRKLRKRIKLSEAVLGETRSLVGEIPGETRRKVAWTVAAIVLVAIGLFVNHYAASRQTLHVVSRLPGQVTVTIDGRDDDVVLDRGHRTVTIGEGKHQAVVRRQDGAETTVDFEIDNNLWQRFTGDSVFVLNPAGAADLVWQEAVYTTVLDPNAENVYQIHFGEEFLVFRDVDYAFEEFPDEISMKGDRAVRSRVGVIDASAAVVLGGFPEGTSPDEMIRFIEHHLDLDPADGDLIRLYYLMCISTDQMDRCRAFLAEGITRKPIAIDWHRIYQESIRSPADIEALAAQYDRLLEEEPENSALLYLRGRLATRASQATPYFDRAIGADPQNPYPLYAKGHQLASRGQFAEARELLAQACRLKPDHADMAHVLFEVRFALGEHAELEKELRESLGKTPTDLDVQKDLLRVLVAGGQAQAAADAHAAFDRQLAPVAQADADELRLSSLITLQYCQGDLEGCLASAEKSGDPENVRMRTAWLQLEMGRPDEAEDVLGKAGPFAGHQMLLLSLAWRLKGDDAKADAWRKKAVEAFASEGKDYALAAELLGKGDQFAMSDVDDVSLLHPVNATVVVALAEANPTLRGQLLDRAETLNVLGIFPHYLLKQAIAAIRE